MRQSLNMVRIARRGWRERRYGARLRQFGTTLALLLSGCGSDVGGGLPAAAPEGFFGAVAGDEPRAALAAREILVQGGNAADAVVAYLFAATVTYPSAASLGGGGVCLVYDPVTNQVEALEFPATRSRASGPAAERPTAVPGLPRGLYALNSRYGRLRFEQLIAPAEALARFGHPMSRTLADDLALVAPALLQDSSSRSVFAKRNKQPLAQGDDLVQLDLAATLSQIRTRGVGEFYGGMLARRLSDGVAAMGGTLDLAELRDYAPRWTSTAALPVGYRLVHAALPPATSGIAALELLRLLDADDRYADAGPPERVHLIVEAGLRVQADRAAWSAGGDSAVILATDRLDGLMAGYASDRATAPASFADAPVATTENPAATGVVAVDPFGQAAACVVTMNNLFGVGRMAPGLGIIMAAPPSSQPQSLVPLIVANHNSSQVVFVGAASGGLAAVPALATTMAEALLAEGSLDRAIAASRALHIGDPDLVVYEAGLDAELRDGLAGAGHTLREVPELGLVNAILCPEGLPANPESCTVATDPRGLGYAFIN